MATIHKCDKCNKNIKDGNKGLDVGISDNGDLLEGNRGYYSYNLCKKCANGFAKYIKKLFQIKKYAKK